MSLNYPQSNIRKLHSPLLDGGKNTDNNNTNIKGKKTYYNPNEDSKNNQGIDETLDTTLFNQNKNTQLPLENKRINDKLIDSLETSLKIANIFIIGTGGILSLLELINIVRNLYSGNYNFGNSLLVFIVAFILTMVSSILCQGFIHLIKATKYIYLNLENQRVHIEKLASFCKTN